MVNTEIRVIIFFAGEDGEALYSQKKNKTRADCGSDHELLTAKFRLKLKKVWKTSRLFRYDLNQIPYNYTVEVNSSQGFRSDRQSAWRAMDRGSWPCTGGMGYPLQYSWASLVAQLVKKLACNVGDLVWSLGWEDPLEKGKATHSSILAWRIPRTV